MNKKFFVIGLLTLVVISFSSINVSAAESSALKGNAEEKTVWIENPDVVHVKNVGTIGEAGSGRFGINPNGELNYNANAKEGLYVKAKDIKLEYSSGEYLTPDNKLYITISVANDNTEFEYDNVRVKYVGSQYNIFDVTSENLTSRIPPSTGSNDHPTNYVFEVTLKDGIDGYMDWNDFYTTGGGHAPVTEDVEFKLSGYVEGDMGVQSFEYSFYLGDPRTDVMGGNGNAGAIQMDYSSDDIELVVDQSTQNVCYKEGASASFKITNVGTQFVFVDKMAFITNSSALTGQTPYDGINLSFELNGMNLVPYWTGEEEMYPSYDFETWQKFTINPGETAILNISVTGGDLENYEGETFIASAVLPFTDLEEHREDIITKMYYSYNRENFNCVA